MKELELREAIMKWRVSAGKEPYWIYMTKTDLNELLNDNMFNYTHYMEFYDLNINDKLKSGETIMKALPYIQVSIDGKITSDGKTIGNIEWDNYGARDKMVLHRVQPTSHFSK